MKFYVRPCGSLLTAARYRATRNDCLVNIYVVKKPKGKKQEGANLAKMRRFLQSLTPKLRFIQTPKMANWFLLKFRQNLFFA